MNDTVPNQSENIKVTISESVQIIASVVLSVTSVCGIFGNILISYVICKNKFLRTHMNANMVSLALADLTVCLLLVPVRLVLYNDATLDYDVVSILCKYDVFLKTFCESSQLFMLVMTSFERHQSIAHPFDKKGWTRRTLCTIGATWLLASVLGAVSAAHFGDGGSVFPCFMTSPVIFASAWGIKERLVTLPLGVLCLLLVCAFYCHIVYVLNEHTTTMQNRFGKNKVKPLPPVASKTAGENNAARIQKPAEDRHSSAGDVTQQRKTKQGVVIDNRTDENIEVRHTTSTNDQTSRKRTAEVNMQTNKDRQISGEGEHKDNIDNKADSVRGTDVPQNAVPNAANTDTHTIKNGNIPTSLHKTSDKGDLLVTGDIGSGLEDHNAPISQCNSVECTSSGNLNNLSDNVFESGSNHKVFTTGLPFQDVLDNGPHRHSVECASKIQSEADDIQTISGDAQSNDQKTMESIKSSALESSPRKTPVTIPDVPSKDHENKESVKSSILESSPCKTPVTVPIETIEVIPTPCIVIEPDVDSNLDLVPVQTPTTIQTDSNSIAESFHSESTGSVPDLVISLYYDPKPLLSTEAVLGPASTSDEVPASTNEGVPDPMSCQDTVPEPVSARLAVLDPLSTLDEVPASTHEGVPDPAPSHEGIPDPSPSVKSAPVSSPQEDVNVSKVDLMAVKTHEATHGDSLDWVPRTVSLSRPVSPRESSRVDVVDMEGKVRREKLGTGTNNVVGAVCVMNNSNKVRGRRKVEMRAAKRIGVLIGTFILLWLPLPVTVICLSLVDNGVSDSAETVTLMAALSVTTVALNPILNVVLNKQVRSNCIVALKKLAKRLHLAQR